MTVFTKVDVDITKYKPKMKAVFVSDLKDLLHIPVNFGHATMQVKADGEFNLIHIDRKECYAINRFGRKTEGLPALKELHMLFQTRGYEMADEVELLAEMYAMDTNGKPLSLPNFVHYLKGDDKQLQNQIHLGFFDIISLDGVNVERTFGYEHRFNMLTDFLHGTLCHVLEWERPLNTINVDNFWHRKVEREGWEGLVIRTNGETYKAKPNRDIDAVIIGINKNNKGYAKGLAKSVKVALMNEDQTYVELGDATVPSEAEARELFGLTRVKLNENNNTVFVKPLVVVQINYISLFPETSNRRYKLLLGGMTEIGQTILARMKSPRIVGYRRDKHACVEDIGLNQIGE